MTHFAKKNNAESTVADNPLTSGATTLNVPSGEGALFGAVFPFELTLYDAGMYPNPKDDPDMEIVQCTARTDDALTIVRAQEGTAAVAHAQGQKVMMAVTAALLDEMVTQDGAQVYAADAGSTDAYAVTLSPAPAELAAGMVVRFKANTINTGACTLNVNGLGAKAIKKNYNGDLADGDIRAGQLVTVMYDSANDAFQMLSQLGNFKAVPKIYATTSTASLTPDTSVYDEFIITAQAENITINNPSNTPLNGEKLTFKLRDNGTSIKIYWGSNYTGFDAILTEATTANKYAEMVFEYDSSDGMWYCISVKTQLLYWSISGLTYDSKSFSVSSQDSNPRSICSNLEGTKMYMLGYGKTVYQYTLSTPWDISTASYASKSFSVSSQASGNPYSLQISYDGTKLYVLDFSNKYIYQYSLSTAWDISTASYSNKSLYLPNKTDESSSYSFHFNTEGTLLYFVGLDKKIVFQFNLVTAWDISTAKFGCYLKSEQVVDWCYTFTVSADGTKMYLSDYSNKYIYQYDLSVAWDPNSAVYNSKYLHDSTYLVNVMSLAFNSDGTILFAGRSGGVISQFSLSTAWDISTATYSKTKSNIFGYSVYGIFFKDSTTVFLIAGSSWPSIHKYTLSSAWDITTISSSLGFYQPQQSSYANGLSFSPDGTNMCIGGSGSNTIYRYALSTPWDISTVSYTGGATFSSYSSGDRDVFINADGTKIFKLHSASSLKTVYQHNCTGWSTFQISYGAKIKDISSQTSQPMTVRMSNNGTRMYIISSNNIYQYKLSTAWDISTATYDTVKTASQDTATYEPFFRSNGAKMFILGTNNKYVYQYSITS